MPQILKLTEKTVFIICEYAVGQGKDEAERAEQVAATYCRPKCPTHGTVGFFVRNDGKLGCTTCGNLMIGGCGFFRDATLNKLSISCLHLKSPYLPQLQEELKKIP